VNINSGTFGVINSAQAAESTDHVEAGFLRRLHMQFKLLGAHSRTGTDIDKLLRANGHARRVTEKVRGRAAAQRWHWTHSARNVDLTDGQRSALRGNSSDRQHNKSADTDRAFRQADRSRIC
jgi:hypothetical protein